MGDDFADDGIAAAAAGRSLGALDVAEMRAGVEARSRTRAPGPELAAVYDVTAGSRPARVFRPSTDASGPVVLWLHGGGWTIGTLDSFDRVCRRLARASGATVVLLDYRLAPEHPWPAQVDDTVEALVWLAARPAELGFAPTAVAVAGDSAGGALAALATLRLARELPAGRPDALGLCYGNTDLAGDYPSRAEKGEGFGLSVEVTEFFNTQWVADRSSWSSPGVSPLRSTDLALLPPTLVVTAEHDHLRDEGEAFALHARDAGVEILLRREDGLIHNFLMLDETSPAAAAAADRFAADLATLLR